MVVDNLLGAWCDPSLGVPSHAGILVEVGPEPPAPMGFWCSGKPFSQAGTLLVWWCVLGAATQRGLEGAKGFPAPFWSLGGGFFFSVLRSNVLEKGGVRRLELRFGLPDCLRGFPSRWRGGSGEELSVG